MIITLEFYEILKREKIVAVIRENTYEKAKFAIEKCIENGIKIIEITLTTPKALELIRLFNSHPNKSQFYIGAGTVLTLNDAENAVKYGVTFLVSPHFSSEVSNYANSNKITYLPGVFTPKEAIEAYNQGHKILKLFPSDILGFKFVSNLKKPYPFLQFMPSGGVSLSNIKDWFLAGCIAVSVGGNLVSGNTDLEIKNNIEKYIGEAHEFEKQK